MLAYALRRVLLAIPVLLVVSVVVFSLLYLTPGDPALVMAGDQATPDQIARIRLELGLDQPPVVRFAAWIWRVLHGDLGQSIFSGQPVALLIGQRLEPTLSLLAASVLTSTLLGVPLGIAAAERQGGIVDRGLSILVATSYSVPVFVSGYILAFLFASKLHWLPVEGFTPISDGLVGYLRSLVLPTLTLSLLFGSLLASVTRASVLETLSQDYIRTAAAKGAGRLRILFGHALKNAAVPIVTVIGGGVATLIGGAVVIENVFAIPGLGTATVDAILHRDYPVIQGIVLLTSTGYVLVNLAVDLTYVVLDPRIRY
ncbi:MAG TPA: ABC transporter permease [Caulobacteraceae bacterium]|nr:ABC transporter permease [Caulobacteraceae bacterium]